MDAEQKQELIALLREMDAMQTRTDEEGTGPSPWNVYRGRVEEALDVDRGTLDTSRGVPDLSEHDARIRSATLQEAARFVHRTYFGTGSSVEKIVAGLRRMAGENAS